MLSARSDSGAGVWTATGADGLVSTADGMTPGHYDSWPSVPRGAGGMRRADEASHARKPKIQSVRDAAGGDTQHGAVGLTTSLLRQTSILNIPLLPLLLPPSIQITLHTPTRTSTHEEHHTLPHSSCIHSQTHGHFTPIHSSHASQLGSPTRSQINKGRQNAFLNHL